MLLPEDGVEDRSAEELRRLVSELLGEGVRLRDENAALREEIARLEGHKGRPSIEPSGMERATPGPASRAESKPSRRSTNARRVLHEERVLAIGAPSGSRFQGCEDFVVQDLRLGARVVRYRRRRWLTPDGRTRVAPLPAGVEGHVGPELRRFVLLQHHQGQVTAERITAFPAGLGVAISKRQVVRLLTGGSTALIAEPRRCCAPARRRRAGSRSTTPGRAIKPGTA